MNTSKGNDKFDKDIDALYVQRKNNTQAPHITFEEIAPKKTYRVKSVFSVLALGGVASFGILAVINHFAHLPENSSPQNVESIAFVKTIDVEKFDHDEQAINMAPPKQQAKVIKPLAVQPTRNFDMNNNIQVRPEAAKAITLNSESVKIIALLPNSLKTHIIEPTFKVMPALDRNITSHQSGNVKLTYKISAKGKVENIKIIQSNVHRDLEKSAKQALSQWRYPPKPNVDEELQVEFHFSGQ